MTTELNIMDLRSVSISGAINLARSRVLWVDGLLRVFTPEGVAYETEAERPQRVPGHIMRWTAKTARGVLTMKGKCMTCGGKRWWRVYSASATAMWRTAC